MPTVSETIPTQLQPKVDAALAWFNQTSEAAGDDFKVTGILDPDEALDGAGDLRLILCGGDRCEQHSFQVRGSANAWDVGFANTEPVVEDSAPQAELDPPPGPRLRWLDDVLDRHAFVVLVFYRGFW
jgi:hypothetical protein